MDIFSGTSTSTKDEPFSYDKIKRKLEAIAKLPDMPHTTPLFYLATKNASDHVSDELLTHDKIKEAIAKLPDMPHTTPLFYASEHVGDDDCYKMLPDNLFFHSCFKTFDKSVEEVYICGNNIRDELIKRGVVFENYKPEDEDGSE